MLKSPNRWRDADLWIHFWIHLIWRCPDYLSRYLIKSLPLVKMLVFDSGTSGWQPRLTDYPLPYQWRGPSPRSLTQREQKMGNHDLSPTGKPWGQTFDSHETLMNRQLSSCLRSLSGGHHHWVRCSWLPDNAVMMMLMTKSLLEFAKGCNLSLGCQFARINLLNTDFANFLISLICCVSMSPEPPLKEHPLRQVRRKQDMLTWGLECAAIFRKFNRSISWRFHSTPKHMCDCVYVIYLAGAYDFVPSFLIYEVLFIIFNFSELYSSCSMRYIFIASFFQFCW